MANNKSNLSNSYSVSSGLPCDIIDITGFPVNMGMRYYVPLITILVLIALITLASNGAFLFVAYKSQRLQTIHNIFLISLSITDLFTGVVVAPTRAISFIFVMNGKYPCAFLWFSVISLDSVGVISFSTIALISLERYLAILHVFYYQRVVTEIKLLVIAFALWIFGTAFSCLCHLIGRPYPQVRRVLLLSLTYSAIAFYIAIFYCYGRIFHEIQRVKRRIKVENAVENDQTVIKEGSKAAKTSAIVISALTLCYLPSVIDYILWPSNQTEHTPRKSVALVKFIAILTILLNSVFNPMIYYARMSLVRTEFKRVFCVGRSSS